MGLDMYLTKKTYIGAEYEHRNVKGIIQLTQGEKNKKIPIDLKRVSYIEESVGYWRKANQIHKWMVENLQEDEDDCGEYDFSKEKMLELLELCKEVQAKSILMDDKVNNGYTIENGKRKDIVEDGKIIVNSNVAEKLLPTASGFFFGGTDYDEYYMNDIKNTIEILEAIFKEESESGKDYFEGEYYYSSSW